MEVASTPRTPWIRSAQSASCRCSGCRRVRVRVDLTSQRGIGFPNYDSMVAKVIVHAESRAEAIARMREALGDLAVSGVRNNIELHQRILDWEAFRSGEYDTTSLERWLAGEGS